MAISFVGSKSFNAAGANSGTFNVSLADLKDTAGVDATLQADDLIIINYGTGDAQDRAFTPPTGYAEDIEQSSTDSSGLTNHCVWRKFMTSTPDTSVDIPNSGATLAGVSGEIIAIRGVDTVTPLDVAVVAATGANTGQPDPGAITPVTSGAWIVVCGASATGTGATLTNPGDLSSTTNHFRADTGADTVDSMTAMGIKTNWSSGAFNPSQFTGGTTGAGDSWCALTIALRPKSATLATGAAAGTGAASATGVAVKPASGSSGGTGAASGFAPTSTGAGAAAGVGAASATGVAIKTASGTSGGIGLATATQPVDLAPTTGHVTYTGYTPTITQDAPTSSDSAFFVPSGQAGTSFSATSRRFRGFAPGQPFYYSYMYRADRTTGAGILTLKSRIKWYGASGPLTSTDNDIAIDSDVNSYTFVEGRHVAPAGAIEGEAVFVVTPAASPMQHDLWIIEPRLAVTQRGAEITTGVEGPSQSPTFYYDYLGAAESGQFNRAFTFKLLQGGVQIASGITWTYKVLSGTFNTFTSADGSKSMTGAGLGTLTASSLGTNTATIEVTASYAGATYVKNFTVDKITASPPAGGGGGSGSTLKSKTGGWTDVNSTSFAAISGTDLNGCTTPAGVTSLNLNASITFDPDVGATNGSWTVELKWQRNIASVWTDVGTAVTGVSSVTGWGGSEPDPVTNPVTINCNKTASSLTANTSYDFRLVARTTTGPRLHYASGTGSVTVP